jgi:hypothetical protein
MGLKGGERFSFAPTSLAKRITRFLGAFGTPGKKMRALQPRAVVAQIIAAPGW